MRKLLRFLTVLFVFALLFLWVASYFERGTEETTATDLLHDIKETGKQISDSFNEFLEESGIKQATADIIEQGGNLIRGTPTDKNPTVTPGTDRQWV